MHTASSRLFSSVWVIALLSGCLGELRPALHINQTVLSISDNNSSAQLRQYTCGTTTTVYVSKGYQVTRLLLHTFLLIPVGDSSEIYVGIFRFSRDVLHLRIIPICTAEGLIVYGQWIHRLTLNSRSFATRYPFPVPETISCFRPVETRHSEMLSTPYAGIIHLIYLAI